MSKKTAPNYALPVLAEPGASQILPVPLHVRPPTSVKVGLQRIVKMPRLQSMFFCGYNNVMFTTHDFLGMGLYIPTTYHW